MNNQVLVNTMGKTRFLQGVAEGDLANLADLGRLEEYNEGEVIFTEGDPVDSVYLVISGQVALDVQGSGVSPQLLLSVGPGESLGWSALMRRRQRVSTAKATARTRVIRFNGEQLLALCDSQPQFGYQIMRATAAALADRLHAMRLRFLDVYRLQPGNFICGDIEIGVD
jgi:CRP/FNR family transcriptional regulator, cyclic AMP receptor protein